MEFWFSERHTDNVELSIRVEKQLFSGQSDFQRIDVFDSVEFGRFLTSDGNVIFSEKDEFTYDEMIVHVPMAVHPNVKKVLVIGGGDGGVARELSHYEEIEVIDVVEPDEMFVEVCKEYFPDNSKGLEDKRVNIYYQDGLRFLRTSHNEYDLMTLQTRSDTLRDFLQKSFTAAATRHLKMTELWYISTAVRSMMRTRVLVRLCTRECTIHFR